MIACSNLQLSAAYKIQPEVSDKEKKILAVGKKHYLKGNYKQALDEANKALKVNPENIEALYAIASCYFALEENRKSISYLKKAAKYKSDYLTGIYLLLGINYERINEPGNALKTYQFAIEQIPDNAELHYRLGLIYSILDYPEIAAETLKKAILINPYHADSHLLLGMLYIRHDYKTPAILALGTYLLLRPTDDRAANVNNMLDDLLESGVLVDNKTGKITVEVNPNTKKDEGDFEIVNNSLSMIRAAMLTENKNISEYKLLQEQFKNLFELLVQLENNNKESTFCFKIYVPFYSKLYKKDLREVYVATILEARKIKEVNIWLEKNNKERRKLEVFVSEYKWK